MTTQQEEMLQRAMNESRREERYRAEVEKTIMAEMEYICFEWEKIQAEMEANKDEKNK